jgi:hypothetical protein
MDTEVLSRPANSEPQHRTRKILVGLVVTVVLASGAVSPATAAALIAALDGHDSAKVQCHLHLRHGAACRHR